MHCRPCCGSTVFIQSVTQTLAVAEVFTIVRSSPLSLFLLVLISVKFRPPSHTCTPHYPSRTIVLDKILYIRSRVLSVLKNHIVISYTYF